MKKTLIALVLFALAFMTACTSTGAQQQFYVRSGTQGYYVAIETNGDTVLLSRPLSLNDANVLVRTLNADMNARFYYAQDGSLNR